MSCEQKNQVHQRRISRRRFLSLGKDVAASGLITLAFGVSVNELLKGTSGISPLDITYSWLRRDTPFIPLHPALMKEYFQSAQRVIGFPELEQTIMEKTNSSRPQSVQELLEIGLNSAHEQGFNGVDGVSMSLLTVTAIGQTNLEFTAHHFPLYLPEGRSLAIGWDKSRHLFSTSYWTFMLSWLNHTGELRKTRKADEFPTGLGWAFRLIGHKRIDKIKRELVKPHPKRNFPFSPSIKGLTPEEERVASLLTDGGIAFEVLSTIKEPTDYYHDPNFLKRQALWIATQRARGESGKNEINRFLIDALKNPDGRFYCGLRDPGVNRDLVANQAGIALGIALFRLAKAGVFDRIPKIPLDDYTEKYGYWDTKINSEGEVIGDFPPTYERILDNYKIEVIKNGVKLSYPI